MSNQNNDNNINTKDFIIGTLVGGIVGAATALLLAPKSGKELRNNINDQAIVLKDKSTELANKAKDTSQTIAKTLQSSSTQVSNKVRDISEKFRQDRQESDVESTEVNDIAETIEEEVNDALQTSYDEHISTSDVETEKKEF